MKDTILQTQQIQSGINSKTPTPRCIITQMSNIKDKEKILKRVRVK